MDDTNLQKYEVWDKPTRWFHWLNALTVFALIGVGLVILNSKSLGISTEGKILLKEYHVLIGYLFVINLIFRFIWGFFGNKYTRWGGILPGGFGYFSAVKNYIYSFFGRSHKIYLGHNPLGKISVAIILLLLLVQAITGLILAGTDIFYPPFGSWIAEWIAADGISLESIKPYAKEMYDPAAYKEMRAFRSPILGAHLYTFYLLLAMIVIHIAAVIVTEIREGGTIITAMFTGRKIVAHKPLDYDEPRDD